MPDAPTMIICGLLYRFPGARFQCWPSPRSIGSLTVWPSERCGRFHSDAPRLGRCTRPASNRPGLAPGYPAACSSTVAVWPGFHPSTSMPKSICVFGVSSICIRGSADGSVESTSRTRPSKGSALRSLGNETENFGAPNAQRVEVRNTPSASPRRRSMSYFTAGS